MLNIPVTRSNEYVKDYESSNDIRNLSDMKNFNEYNERQKVKDYPQVFGQKLGFTRGLSILDLLFNEGKHASEYFFA